MHPFIAGVEYKRPELLAFVGSKQAQSGVIWGSREPGCLICTSGGRHGRKAGYADELRKDGTWYYFGQGQTGDQSLLNSANARLAEGDRSILLFTTREPTSLEVSASGGYGKLFAFRGSFNVSGFETIRPSSGSRIEDDLLRFHLLPAEEGLRIFKIGGEDNPHLPTDLKVFQARLQAETSASQRIRLSLAEYRRRSSAVHCYALSRAGGRCEACAAPAPFMDEQENPFLEVHHIHRLADDGLDAPINVAAICPNCHRAAHHSKDRIQLNRRLAANIAELEEQVTLGARQMSPSHRPDATADVVLQNSSEAR